MHVGIGDDLIAVTTAIDAAAMKAGVANGAVVIGTLDHTVELRAKPVRIEWDGDLLAGWLISADDMEWSLRQDPRAHDAAMLCLSRS